MFDANDRYCLDGQRLVAINGGTYGAAGTEYRTERESFSKIVGYGGTTGNTDNFKVWTKAGQIIEYGNTADSRIEVPGSPQVRVWAVNKIGDTSSNYLTFTYTEDATNGDYYPARIDYTGNTAANLAPYNSVRFIYESRPDSVPMYFNGRMTRSTQRLTKVQTYAKFIDNTDVQSREYQLSYGAGTTTNRSRITSILECAKPSNACKPAVNPTWTDFGSMAFNAGTNWTSQVTSFLADVNGDGRADLIAQKGDGIYVALSSGTSVGASTKQLNSFGYLGQGYSNLNVTPLFVLDVNADGYADVVGFSGDGVYVALADGVGGFNAPVRWIDKFGTADGWNNMDVYPRTFADVNGDGRPDIVGFKNDGVYVALNTGTGFGLPTLWTTDFGTTSGFSSNAVYPRFVVDVNGDGRPDIVGFSNYGASVALNTGTGFSFSSLWSGYVGVNNGWTTQDTYPRALADVNGDGLPDIVGFKNDGTYVSFNTGTSFLIPALMLADFGTATITPYSSQKAFPRYLADVNGDGKADIVGFAAGGVQVSLSTGNGFNPSSQWVTGFGSSAGYNASSSRQLADIDGDGFPDIVGTLSGGTSVALSGRTTYPDWITAFPNGLGTAITLDLPPASHTNLK